MNATRAKQAAAPASPEAVAPQPQVPPTQGYAGMSDHSFTLQAVMEMQKSLGEMNANLNGMKGTLEGVKTKVDDLVGWKHKILGGAAVLGAVCTLLGILLAKGADYVTLKQPATPVPVNAAPSQGVGSPPANK